MLTHSDGIESTGQMPAFGGNTPPAVERTDPELDPVLNAIESQEVVAEPKEGTPELQAASEARMDIPEIDIESTNMDTEEILPPIDLEASMRAVMKTVEAPREEELETPDIPVAKKRPSFLNLLSRRESKRVSDREELQIPERDIEARRVAPRDHSATHAADIHIKGGTSDESQQAHLARRAAMGLTEPEVTSDVEQKAEAHALAVSQGEMLLEHTLELQELLKIGQEALALNDQIAAAEYDSEKLVREFEVKKHIFDIVYASLQKSGISESALQYVAHKTLATTRKGFKDDVITKYDVKRVTTS